MLKHVLKYGELKMDRTGTGTVGVFGYQARFDLTKGFPIVTEKEVHFRSVFHELIWFIRGDTNVKYLQDNGVRIWNEWADEDGNLGPVYGEQWRAWDGGDGVKHDQLSNVIAQIINNPYSRRHIVSAWNISVIDQMKLPPCHILFQFYVSSDKKLSLHLYQRSADLFLGVPFNISSYALLLHIVARITGLSVGELIYSIGDMHLYNNHIDQAKLLLSREPYPLPELSFNDGAFRTSTRTIPRTPEEVSRILGELMFDDISLLEYKHHPKIPAKVSV